MHFGYNSNDVIAALHVKSSLTYHKLGMNFEDIDMISYQHPTDVQRVSKTSVQYLYEFCMFSFQYFFDIVMVIV